jgi:hypothetical protein
MASTVDSGESETVKLLNVASNLAINEVRPPISNYIPVKLIDPGNRPISWHCTISIS